MFAVFIFKGGKWEMWGQPEATNNTALAQELAYVVDSLGMTAKIFRKK